MQLKIPIISTMLLISDNLKHWSPFLTVAEIISILTFDHVVSLGTITNKAGFERQQMLEISLDTLENKMSNLGSNHSP